MANIGKIWISLSVLGQYCCSFFRMHAFERTCFTQVFVSNVGDGGMLRGREWAGRYPSISISLVQELESTG